ncbi:nucleotidyltransferase family protein [Proteiniclasticum ruminis]|uniref:Uncharacterized nucleotidyltransferase n=1 Tax=Proteiniclasticum ruminis TaxID=398199 RepID=A0A1G8SBF4_9CLOT|nr:nucleotidyltransferase family protein [Proteiniclasticum ruminis]SDJ26548.1 Uncharacterised nucleotidyltransferase [Proteiniclasticum ruminis]
MPNRYDVLTNASFKYCELSLEEINNIKALYDHDGQDKVYNFAKQKKILPFVANLMCKLCIDNEFWKIIKDEYIRRNEGVISSLDLIFSKFAENSVNKVFVTENFGALLSIDGDISLFSSGDVDMYADISEKERIYRSFKELGYTIKERYSHNKLISTSFYNDDIFLNGFHFGVAWNPLSRLKLPSFVNADDFVEWDKLWNYKDTSIKLPDHEALMYICLLHISLHSFSRAPDIRLYIDINNLSLLPINWNKLVELAQRDNTMVRLLTACILAQKLLDVEIPQHILDYRMKYNKSITRLLKLVYSEQNNSLIYEPKRFKVLFIEALMNDMNMILGIKGIVLPDSKWVRDFYVGSKGNLALGYIKHFKNIL